MIYSFLFFLFVLGSLTLSCSTKPEYHRVEEFPMGMNTDLWASANNMRIHTTKISHRYQGSYSDVWEATIRVSRKFEKRYGRPILRINKKEGSIHFEDQNFYETTHLYDKKQMANDVETLRLKGWKEQVTIKVRTLKNGLIKVTVYRTVEGMVYFSPAAGAIGFGVRSYNTYLEPEVSNGEFEDWILTKIEDEVESPDKQSQVS